MLNFDNFKENTTTSQKTRNKGEGQRTDSLSGENNSIPIFTTLLKNFVHNLLRLRGPTNLVEGSIITCFSKCDMHLHQHLMLHSWCIIRQSLVRATHHYPILKSLLDSEQVSHTRSNCQLTKCIYDLSNKQQLKLIIE